MSEGAATSPAPGPASGASRKTPLFFQRRFLPMWAALSLGAFTDNMLKQALSIALVYGVIAAPLISNDDALPIVGSLFPIAMLLFSTISGQFADKYETSLMFRRTKLAEFILMILAAIGFLLESGGVLILTLFLMGAQSAFFSPARTGAMPKYLSADELVRGNALCGGGLFVSVMLGIVIGGLLVVQENGRAVVAAILVIAALAGWLAIRLAPPAPANAPDLRIDWNAFGQARKLVGYVLNAPGVIRPILGVSWYWSVGALLTVTVPLFVRDTLYGDASVVTVMMALFAVGAAIGAVGAALLSKGRSGLGFSAAGAAGAGLMMLTVFALSRGFTAPADGALLNAAQFFTAPAAVLLGLCFALASISASLFVVPLQAAVQRRAPPDKRARILAANNMVNAGGAIIGSLLVLLVTRTPLDAAAMFLFAGLAQILLAVYMFRRKQKIADGLYDEMLDKNAAPKPAAP